MVPDQNKQGVPQKKMATVRQRTAVFMKQMLVKSNICGPRKCKSSMSKQTDNKQFWQRWASCYGPLMQSSEPLYAAIAQQMQPHLTPETVSYTHLRAHET